MEKTIHLIIRGRVQGVCFRMYTQQKALSLNLKGTVKNLFDGSVEVYATGEEENLKKLIDWCWHGPPAARVVDVSEKWLKEVKKFNSFSIIY